MRAAYDNLIGLLTRTVSGGSGQWAINKHKAALGAEQNSLGGMGGKVGEGKWGSFCRQDLSFTPASGWLQVNWSKVCTAEERRG